jgi:hypothetical protein
MSERSVEDRLRQEYFTLLPDAQRTLEELEAEVRHRLLPLLGRLDKYEKIRVTSRVKDCESALGALRRRQEGSIFDTERADSYSLASLNDLAGVRVLVFPRTRWLETDSELRARDPFHAWTPDHVLADEAREPLVFKYHGHCSRNSKLRAELQIAPMLVGLFWEVEHSAIYKPSPQLKGVLDSLEMKQPVENVYKALKAFEEEFERLIRRDPLKSQPGH